jgi:hypothetical protein
MTKDLRHVITLSTTVSQRVAFRAWRREEARTAKRRKMRTRVPPI